MLFDPFTKKPVTNVWHEENWQRWRPLLTQSEYDAIQEEMHKRLDVQQFFNTSWEPGHEWEHPFLPIYVAVGQNELKAKLFWGLIAQVTIMEHPLDFGYKKNEKLDGDREPGTTYFRIERDADEP
jgi:hypothetical protein